MLLKVMSEALIEQVATTSMPTLKLADSVSARAGAARALATQLARARRTATRRVVVFMVSLLKS
jgi:hypothetical protein